MVSVQDQINVLATTDTKKLMEFVKVRLKIIFTAVRNTLKATLARTKSSTIQDQKRLHLFVTLKSNDVFAVIFKILPLQNPLTYIV